MYYIAEEVRELLARLGFRTLQEAVGRRRGAGHDQGVGALEGAKAGKLRSARGARSSSSPESPFMNQDPFVRAVRTMAWTRR